MSHALEQESAAVRLRIVAEAECPACLTIIQSTVSPKHWIFDEPATLVTCPTCHGIVELLRPDAEDLGPLLSGVTERLDGEEAETEG